MVESEHLLSNTLVQFQYRSTVVLPQRLGDSTVPVGLITIERSSERWSDEILDLPDPGESTNGSPIGIVYGEDEEMVQGDSRAKGAAQDRSTLLASQQEFRSQSR